MFELVIVWASGERQVYEYDTPEQAEEGARNMLTANGEQITWWCVREAV